MKKHSREKQPTTQRPPPDSSICFSNPLRQDRSQNHPRNRRPKKEAGQERRRRDGRRREAIARRAPNVPRKRTRSSGAAGKAAKINPRADVVVVVGVSRAARPAYKELQMSHPSGVALSPPPNPQPPGPRLILGKTVRSDRAAAGQIGFSEMARPRTAKRGQARDVMEAAAAARALGSSALFPVGAATSRGR